MESNVLYEALETIANVQQSSDLEKLVNDLREIYQLSHLIYCGHRLPGRDARLPFLVVTYPQEWIERYLREKFFQIDPVFAASRSSFLPVDWLTLDRKSPAAKFIWAEAARYGIGSQGMSIPMRGPDGDVAALAFTADTELDKWRAFQRSHVAELTLVGHHLHDRVTRILAAERGLKVRTSLSPRERECLQFLVDGRAPKQIAGALNLSEGAVRLSLKRARAKLGAPSLMQAVALAVRSNLIEIDGGPIADRSSMNLGERARSAHTH